jgi:hypothetical protein
MKEYLKKATVSVGECPFIYQFRMSRRHFGISLRGTGKTISSITKSDPRVDHYDGSTEGK